MHRFILLLCTRLKAVFSRCENVAKDRNTRDHVAWTVGNEDPMHDVCLSHTVYLAHGQARIQELSHGGELHKIKFAKRSYEGIPPPPRKCPII